MENLSSLLEATVTRPLDHAAEEGGEAVCVLGRGHVWGYDFGGKMRRVGGAVWRARGIDVCAQDRYVRREGRLGGVRGGFVSVYVRSRYGMGWDVKCVYINQYAIHYCVTATRV